MKHQHFLPLHQSTAPVHSPRSLTALLSLCVMRNGTACAHVWVCVHLCVLCVFVCNEEWEHVSVRRRQGKLGQCWGDWSGEQVCLFDVFLWREKREGRERDFQQRLSPLKPHLSLSPLLPPTHECNKAELLFSLSRNSTIQSLTQSPNFNSHLLYC